ncbi:MAG: hypothetical protein RBR09_03395 [Desulfobulbaceae bacterium]|jgi:hypothetical protein|nr:hypothetical protein [Desulfobulbaceae bacterium]MDY0350276.1 hypothetical protein [Desulfobulbaceae bacterium]
MKKLVTAIMVVAFALSSAGIVMAQKLTCTVDAVEGDTVTMTCKGADKLKAGDEVQVRGKKKGAVEGC